jgi:tRNA threonylcarbamoyl adenosine modification protein YeaZ
MVPDVRVLAIDTATAATAVALVSFAPDGSHEVLAQHRHVDPRAHAEVLAPLVDRMLAEAGLQAADLTAIVAGDGPGPFTGLRVGLATAKGLAHGLGIPLVGVSTASALLHAAGPGAVLIQPAGPRDRVVSRPGAAPELLTGDTEPLLAAGERLVAVDLDGRASDDALAEGARAWDGLGAALIELGAARLRTLGWDGRGELETVVPEYVTLPRGVAASSGEVSWSRDPR